MMAIVGVTVVLLAFTLLVVLDPRVAPALVNEPLDLVLTAASSLVALAVAILAWIHFREDRDRAALWRASAFLVLAAGNLFFIGLVVGGQADPLGLSLATAGQLPLWTGLVARGVAAALFVVAGTVALRREDARETSAALVVLGPTALVVVVSALMALAQNALPQLLAPTAIAQLRADPTAPLLIESGPLLIALQGGIGLAFVAAAVSASRLHVARGRQVEQYLAIGFILAAFAQVHSALHPGSYASLVTTGDLLRVAFYAVLLLVVAAEARADIRALRDANAELLALREADVERATAEERARLAREIHDGMSQELWYAKLKQSRLAGVAGLPEEARQLADEVSGAIEAALSEARQAILALRPAEGASFAQVLQRFVQDFSDRFGIPAESSVDPVAETLPARQQAELLRIVQEALNNVHRHADATRVRVELQAVDGALQLVVADNGRGFTLTPAAASRYGLRSMRERASIIGAEIRIDSAPSDGTRVLLLLAQPMEGGG